ncbi:MAG: hypothetical protein KKD28_06470 [Chloroflexi bacterium]|nr:hypothetical protein [Chloroflexota bacterium]MBU1661100.1 hypothetical protein [Chloroflexota bacterium]
MSTGNYIIQKSIQVVKFRCPDSSSQSPSLETGETMVADVRALVELGEQQVVELGL